MQEFSSRNQKLPGFPEPSTSSTFIEEPEEPWGFWTETVDFTLQEILDFFSFNHLERQSAFCE